jgi:geranylgeranyl diphosphate synthase type I
MDLDDWIRGIRVHIDSILGVFFESKLEEAASSSPQAVELVREVRDLTMRGGKRLRPIVTAAAYQACCGKSDVSVTFEVGAALELLQTYLLIHDDWMDEDDERRGGPAVHYVFQKRHGDPHLGASLGILAGDLASTFAWELLLRGRFPQGRRDTGLQLFIEIQKEVFAGQQLDLLKAGDVERMHDLKTGSYTSRGPAALGGLLADADEPSMRALSDWSAPVGVAFQLRDDLLGTFGNAAQTGKPGDDLLHQKHNAIVAAFRRLDPSAAQQAAFDVVWGSEKATPAQTRAAAEALSAAREQVESRLAFLTDEASSALASSPFAPDAKRMLEGVTRRLTDRGS